MGEPASSGVRRASIAGACALGLLLGAACTGALGDPDETKGDETSGAPGGTGGDGAGTPGGAGGGDPGGGGAGSGAGGAGAGAGGGGATAAELMCQRWNADRAGLGEGSWSGDVAACNAGDVSADGRANALKLVNLYRSLAGLPPVTTDPLRDQRTQECALMMDANGMLSHFPPMSWTCYTADGAQAAGNSNIASTAGVTAVDLYMADPGNDTTIGHRRWVLSNSLGPIGIGTTNSYSCMWVIGGNGTGDNAYTPWPSAGPFPVEAVNASFVSLDTTGWTIQSDSIDLSSAQVTVTDGGQDRPMSVNQLAGGYGSTYAIRMVPQGWTSQPGHTYAVTVGGVNPPISYEVQMVACN